MGVDEVTDFLDELSSDSTMPRNVKAVLCEIKGLLVNCSGDEMPLRVDSALQKLEEISNDPNLSPFGRTELWNLTSAIEALNAIV